MNKKELGSKTAKGGFINEQYICNKFLNWQQDEDAQKWLEIMGYNYNKITVLKAIKISPNIKKDTAFSLGITKDKYNESIKFKKADIQIRLEILLEDTLYIENLSLKKANKKANFNQIDKRSVDTYGSIWHFSDNITKWLKLFTGEFDPKDYLSKNNYHKLHDKRRILISEMPTDIQKEIIKFFTENKMLIICDILKGRGGLSADWFLVTEKYNTKFRWILKHINYVLNHYSQGEVQISPRGSLKIGQITMQRKGGTPDPTSLQFKIKPLSLFNE